MRIHGRASPGLQLHQVSCMIDMSVGQQNRTNVLWAEASLMHRAPDPFRIAGKSRVEQHHAVSIRQHVWYAHDAAHRKKAGRPIGRTGRWWKNRKSWKTVEELEDRKHWESGKTKNGKTRG